MHPTRETLPIQQRWDVGTIATPLGPVSMIVVSGPPPDYPRPYKDTLREFGAIGGGSMLAGGLLIAMAPGLAGGAVIGVPLVIGLGATVYGIQRHQTGHLAQALLDANPGPAIAEAMRARAPMASREAVPVAAAQLMLRAWGIVGPCAVMTTDLVVERHGMEILHDQLRLTSGEASPDAPSVQCATFERFAKNDGQLLRLVMADYAQITAILALERLKGLQ